MIDFTPQESRILIFLVAALLLGSAVSLYRHRRPGITTELSVNSPHGADRSQASDSSVPGEPGVPPPRVNINTATRQELQTLPGIGPQLAQRIIAYRQEHGSFRTAHAITEVRGIGEKTFLKLKDSIIVE